MKKIIFIISFLIMLISLSCSTVEEPERDTASNAFTRSEQNAQVRTYSIEEVKTIANNALKRPEINPKNISTEAVVCNDKEIKNRLLSDTVAYIVNYPDDKGFVIVANDSRTEPILAYSYTGRLSYKDNPLIKLCFLDNIGKYLASLEDIPNPGSESSDISQAITKHIIIEPRIANEIGPFSPFDQVVIKKYPTCNAGLMNVASVNIISNSLTKLSYEGYNYDFESINYALEQGYGYSGDIGNFTLQSNGSYVNFINSYDGAVDAISQLLYSVGKACKTIYPESGCTWTWYTSVPPVLKSMGLTVTETFNDKSLAHIYDLLNEEYFVEIFGLFVKNDGGGFSEVPFLLAPIGIVADGCDVIVNQQNDILSGMLHCVWGIHGLGDGFYNFEVMSILDTEHFAVNVYFGAKGEGE